MTPDLFGYSFSRYILLGVVIIFAVFALSRSYLRIKHGSESVIEFVLWTILWTGIIIVVLFPNILTIPAKLLGIGRGVDVLVYFGIIVLFYSVYRIYSKIERLEQEITSLTRANALKILDNKNRMDKTIIPKHKIYGGNK
jgi:small membrane protein